MGAGRGASRCGERYNRASLFMFRTQIPSLPRSGLPRAERLHTRQRRRPSACVDLHSRRLRLQLGHDAFHRRYEPGSLSQRDGRQRQPSSQRVRVPLSRRDRRCEVRRIRQRGAARAAFARTGNPNNPEIPHWPPYTAADRSTMVVDNQWKVVKDPNREARLAMEQLPPRSRG